MFTKGQHCTQDQSDAMCDCNHNFKHRVASHYVFLNLTVSQLNDFHLTFESAKLY